MTLKHLLELLCQKSTRRLKILKRLASPQWGTDKTTQTNVPWLCPLSIRNLLIQILSSDTAQASLNRIESQAVRFITGGMRSAQTSTCHIDINIIPLTIRREAAAL